MGLLDAGKDYIASVIIGETVTKFDSTHAYVCVGDSNDVFDAADTDLQAATNKLRKLVDSGYPTRTGPLMAFKATFSGSEANHAWKEWGIANGAASGAGVLMLNRLVEDNGVKAVNQVWVIEVDLTITDGS